MNKRIVIYTSPTCGPCKQLKALVAEKEDDFLVPVEVVELSDGNREDFLQRNIRSVPVVSVQNASGDGEVDRLNGFPGREVLLRRLREWGAL
ncbi:glutaredoxin family protein [Cupriavidus metallidurans]|uniref:glutaredoxin family protein n=1 Tax=Cupriavidus metallidurans TaxID=119219 RepID=UPI001CCB070C|nr:glutaredoxin domain-containing protein [Cupriavidus metallidurans]UBM12773.1 glutaredoxin [Cupriavidus metallidurans]